MTPIEAAEQAWGGPVAASRHLGVGYRQWCRYKAGENKMPEMLVRSIAAHLRLEQAGPNEPA